MFQVLIHQDHYQQEQQLQIYVDVHVQIQHQYQHVKMILRVTLVKKQIVHMT